MSVASSDGPARTRADAPGPLGGRRLITGEAGSGRTTTLLAHHAALVRELDGAASRVLCLAPSPSAAALLRSALLDLVEPPYDELRVQSFGAFAEALLRDHGAAFGLDPGFVALAPAERVALLLDALEELTLRHHEIRGNPAPLLARFVSRIDSLKRDMVSPAALIASADEAARAAEQGDDASRSAAARELEFAHLFAAHDRLLDARGALASSDLAPRAFGLLHEKPDVRAGLCAGVDAVLIDDFHEATFAERALVTLLCEEIERVTITADPEQAPEGAVDAVGDLLRAFPDARTEDLGRSRRCPPVVRAAARGALGAEGDSVEGGSVRFWRCESPRAQSQAVAARAAELVAEGSPAGRVAVLASSPGEASAVCSALEERAVAFRLHGSAAYFQRAEVRDVLAWLRLLADPADSGAVVRALARPPIGLHSVDIARLTQLSRRRKTPVPATITAALEGPQLSPEGRDRAQTFLRLYRPAAAAFEDRRPDEFVLRLIERVGIRRQQVFATHADTVERLRNIAALPELASAFMRREPDATPRDFARYLRAVADSGLEWEEMSAPAGEDAVQVMDVALARGREFDHVFALVGDGGDAPGARRELYTASSRARETLTLSHAAARDGERVAEPSAAFEDARAATGAPEEWIEEELFGPAEGLHSTFRTMRDELLDEVAAVGGRLGEMRLDTTVDVSNAVARFLELVKVSALIDRSSAGQRVEDALAEVNALVSAAATPEQRELMEASELDGWLRDASRDPAGRPSGSSPDEPSLDPFIPRRGDGVMLSASDIETYRLCPLKYKFARVFRIPQEATIHQRFGIVLHQVLERFHKLDDPSRADLFDLFEASWRRGGFGSSDDELQFRERALDALERYWGAHRDQESEPVWFERSFSFQLGPHLLRGRVDRVDRLPDGTYELIDYKTGKAKTEDDLRHDIQLSVYQMGARESWDVATSAQSYYYVMTGEKVPVAHSEEELERVRAAVSEIGEGILRQQFQPTPSEEICSFCDYRIICPAAER